jgi:hypothetical protein
MKNLVSLLVLLCWACAKPDVESEKKTLIQLIDDETKYAAAADSVSWAKCWVNDSEAKFTIASVDGAQQFVGWDNINTSIKNVMKDSKPFELELNRDNYHFVIDGNVAFVSFDQQDNWGGEGRKTKESRTLRKVDGQWKIVDANVITFSSYDRKNTPSFHVAKEKLNVDPRTSFRNQSGLGGMYVGYVEAPGGTDFTPLFAGLPQNNCPSPHWGYLFEGAIRIKYPDGKEEVVNAGEVFYWPAPHTGVVEKNAKFIDFSPEAEFAQVMDQIAENIQKQSAQ